MKRYQLATVSWYEALKKLALPFSCCMFLFIFSILNERGIEFIGISFSLCVLCIFLIGKAKKDGEKEVLRTDAWGINFFEAKHKYPWTAVSNVEVVKVRRQVMAASKPGYIINFENGDSHTIDQRLEGYVELYKELYDHKIEGADKPLYLYEVDITGSKADMNIEYSKIYYPDKNEVVVKKGVAT